MMTGIFAATVGSVAFILLACLARRLRRAVFFRSRRYRENLARLQSFSADVSRRLAGLSEIGDAEADALVNGAASVAGFFRNQPYKFPDYVGRGLALYDNALELMRQHDRELRFYGGHYKAFKTLLEEDRYIPYSQWKGLLDQGELLLESLNGKAPLFRETPGNAIAFLSLPAKVDAHNKAFVENEFLRCSAFFDTIAGYSLDKQQRECCVVDEDAGLVVAGAGSGKTSVIMAKVAYLVKVRGISPDDILLVSFTNKAAQEMTERIAQCVGTNTVAASTFHKFGSGILKRFGGSRREIADDSLLMRVVHQALSGDDAFVPEDYDTIVRYFAYYFNQDQSGKMDASLGERIEREKALNIQTLRSMVYDAGKTTALGGEKVKSLEEVLIANFLFLNGVEYEYEKPYTKDYVSDANHRAYRPDFYLPEFDVYLEHYGVDETDEPPPFFSEVEKRKYKDGMHWKRELHLKAGNKYVESYSWWNSNGILFENLAASLSDMGVVFRPRDAKGILAAIRANARKQLDGFEKLVASFISLFKSNDFPEGHFDELIAQEAETPNATVRQRMFLSIAKRLYIRYQKELAKAAASDFNDMINEATRIVGGLSPGTLGYKHVIVDEYQDISTSRMRLLKAVVGNSGAHLFCVGDDWQSIFRFAGSDISLFTRFEDCFGHAATMKIENTYRNSQELIDIMSRFIMRNPGQIGKMLKSDRHYAEPIRIFFFNDSGDNERDTLLPLFFNDSYNGNRSYPQALDDAIGAIAKEAGGCAAKVLLLGRTQYDEARIGKSRDLARRGSHGEYAAPRFPNLSFQFLTVHKAKGLEGDFVILLNAENGQMGFPNRIAEDPVLQLVLGDGEEFEYAEERRLFYVALTRTRNSVLILAPSSGYSPFLGELFDIGVSNPAEKSSTAETHRIACPKCRTGELVCRDGPHGRFSACSNFPGCDYRVKFIVTAETPRCPECGGFLVMRHPHGGGPGFLGCTNYPYCRHIAELDCFAG